jgi:hypothetical protein
MTLRRDRAKTTRHVQGQRVAIKPFQVREIASAKLFRNKVRNCHGEAASVGRKCRIGYVLAGHVNSDGKPKVGTTDHTCSGSFSINGAGACAMPGKTEPFIYLRWIKCHPLILAFKRYFLRAAAFNTCVGYREFVTLCKMAF